MDVSILEKLKSLLDDRIEVVSSSSSSDDESNIIKTQHLSNNVDISKIDDYVDVIPDSILNTSTKNRLVIELDSCAFPKDSSDCKYQFVSNTNMPYEFGGKSLPPHKLSGFPCVASIMQNINDRYNTQLDSCLIAYYSSGSVTYPLHADDEMSLDQNSPIYNITVGSDRLIEFCDIRTKVKLGYANVSEGSILVMKKGCQQNLRHQLPALPGAGPRFCLSFRKTAAGVLKLDNSINSTPPPSPPPKQSPPSKVEHIIVGDSLTRDIKINNCITITKPGGIPTT